MSPRLVSTWTRWRGRLPGAALLLCGLGSAGLGISTYLEAWSTAQQWQSSEEAQALERQEAAPTPVWIAPMTPQTTPQALQPLPTAVPISQPPPPTVPPPPALATADQLVLDNGEFRFLDPPEPDAHARVAITVRNTAEGPSERILLGIPKRWFDQYRIIGSAPAVSEDRVDEDGLRTFSFPPVAAGQSETFELHVAPVGEEIPPPTLRIMVASGALIGSDAPATQAPPPRPGPVMSLEIPRLKLKSGVVQTRWEPPPFTVGQLRDSASVTRGNTILIGHLSGAAGNVFAHLDRLEPGDRVMATSRGLPYEFVVSRIIHSNNVDVAPMAPVAPEQPRLTLMTCAGIF
ncbi:MAG: sortase, partial [Chloroflexota bacterium]|nr:sortase [Chloroflexota bacterium]